VATVHDASSSRLERGNEQTLLDALDADERENLAGLLRKLLLSPPFRELDPAPGSLDAPSDGDRRG
jgi:hypothetical protein